jgi:hypothetical protein
LHWLLQEKIGPGVEAGDAQPLRGEVSPVHLCFELQTIQNVKQGQVTVLQQQQQQQLMSTSHSHQAATSSGDLKWMETIAIQMGCCVT